MGYGIFDSIIYLCGNAFRVYTTYLFFRIFFKPEASGFRQCLRKLCYILFFLVNSAGFLYFQWAPNLILASNFMGVFLIAVFYESKWRVRVCAALASVVLYVLCEDTVARVLIHIGVDHLLSIGLPVSALTFFMVVSVIQRSIDARNNLDFAWQEWLITIFVPGCTIFLAVIIFDNCESEAEIVFGGIGMILLNLLLFYLLEQIFVEHEKNLRVVSLEQQNQAYENQIQLMRDADEKISALRHDMKNHFLVLQQIARQENYEKIQGYLDNLNDSLEPGQTFVATGNAFIDSMINLKLNHAMKQGAQLELDIKIPQDLFVGQKDICIVLGNLLDNALRALEDCEADKRLFLQMREVQGMLTIQVKNSYTNKVKKAGKFFRTTKKGEGHGLGLKIVEQIVRDYQGELDFKTDHDFFTVTLLMYLQVNQD